MSPKDKKNVSILKTEARRYGDDLQEAAHQAGERVRGAFNFASRELDVVADEIRANPIRSSAIALGVGALLALLLRR